MQRAVILKCGHTQDVLATHQKVARGLMKKYAGRDVPFAIQRGLWFSSAAAYEGQSADAIALVVQIDRKRRILPAPKEIDALKPPPGRSYKPKPRTNILFIIGNPESFTTLMLVDAVPRYLDLVSNIPTVLVVESSLAYVIEYSFGWPSTTNPIAMSNGFISMKADGNPFTSVCARAIAYDRKAAGENRVFVDSLGTGDDSSPVLVADDDARNLATRIWENWQGTRRKEDKKVVEVTPPSGTASVEILSFPATTKDVLDRPA